MTAAVTGQSLAGDQRSAFDALIDQLEAEIVRLQLEVELWKDRCAAERQAHEATIEHYDTMMDDMRYAP
jgi:hypothetical protein